MRLSGLFCLPSLSSPALCLCPKPPLFPKPPFFPCNLNGPMCDPFDKLFLEEVLLDVGNQLVFPFTGTWPP